MSSNNIKNKLNKAIDYLKSFDLINVVYLHGSYTKGTMRPDSDIDFAVLIESDNARIIKKHSTDNYLERV